MAFASTAPIQTLGWNSILVKSIWVLVVVQIAFGVLGAMTTWAVAFVPLLALIGCIAVLWPRAGVYFLTASLFLRVDLPGLVGVYSGDLIALLLIGGLALHLTLSGTWRIRTNPLIAPMAAILAIFALSLMSTYDVTFGVTNWFRHLQMLAVILVVSEVLGADDVKNIVNLVLFASVILAIPNIIEAARLSGSQRVFGIGSMFFPFYVAIAIMYCCIGYLLAEQAWKRRLLVVLAVILISALIVSQTREAMLHAAVGILLTCGLVWQWARRARSAVIRRRVLTVLLGSVLVILIFLSSAISIFEAPANRVFQAVEGRSNTIFIRLFLWKTAGQVFLDSPVLGTGLGQSGEWYKFLPLWRLDPMSEYSRGAGVHNDFISYAAETGLLGLTALFWFFARVVKVGWREYKHITDQSSFLLLLAVWIPCVATFVRFFYGTHTFYSLGGLFNCLYFGLLVSLIRSTQKHQHSV